MIQDFEAKIIDLFQYIRTDKDGERLVIKINSHVSEAEIYDDFARLYRRYRAFNRKTVGDYFFKETEDLAELTPLTFQTSSSLARFMRAG